VKCTNKLKKTAGVSGLILASFLLFGGCASSPTAYTEAYEAGQYTKDLYRGTLFAEDLCVAAEDVALDGYTEDPTFHAAGLFDLKEEKVLYADRIHDRLYPASTTKLMTAYLALKYGNPDDVVTVGENATSFAPDEQVCGLQTGDRLTLGDLLAGLLLYSGNDCATAIAEHISGSVEKFAELMNQEAWNLGAVNSHFVNPHGLHSEDHYTTAYDLYLIFNACAKDERFIDLISQKEYTVHITGADNTVRTDVWAATNYYSSGEAPMPEGVTVLGGKTGTTNEAGNCVILYEEDAENNPYISVIMGAGDKPTLYTYMSQLLTAGIRDK